MNITVKFINGEKRCFRNIDRNNIESRGCFDCFVCNSESDSRRQISINTDHVLYYETFETKEENNNE